MPGRVQLLALRDFTGGLNYLTDPYQLRPSESPEALNVDMLPAGGVKRRQAVRTLNAVALSSVPTNLFAYYSQSQIVAQVGQTIAYGTASGSFTAVSQAAAPFDVAFTGVMRAAAMGRLTGSVGDNLYLTRGTNLAVRWNGSAATALLDACGAYNDNIGAAAGGKFPRASYVTQWNGFMVAASTLEGTTAFKSRVRWSHPGEPEDWRTNDYVDVNPGDGDEIVGIAPFGERLLIFKHHSVYVMAGYSPETFQVTQVSSNVGAVSQEAIASSPLGVAFFDEGRGVFLYDGSGVQWAWDRMQPKLADNSIPTAYRSRIVLGWHGARLLCSVPWETSTTNARTFVMDTRVGRGSWTAYAYGVGSLMDFHANGVSHMDLATSPTTGYILNLRAGTGLDNFGSGDAGFKSYFRTSWIDAGATGVRKRWRRPRFILSNMNAGQFPITSWRDYVTCQAGATSTIFVPPCLPQASEGSLSTPLLYDSGISYDNSNEYDAGSVTVSVTTTPLVWGTGKWGQALWGGQTNGTEPRKVMPGPALGRAISVQLQIQGPNDLDWTLDGIQIPYIVMRVR